MPLVPLYKKAMNYYFFVKKMLCRQIYESFLFHTIKLQIITFSCKKLQSAPYSFKIVTNCYFSYEKVSNNYFFIRKNYKSLLFCTKKEIIHSFFLLRFSSFSVSLISLDCHFKCLIFLVRSVSLNLLLCVYVYAVRSNCTQCSNCTNTINAARVQQLIIHGGDLWSADAHVKVSAILNVHVKVSAIFFMST